MVAAGLTPGGSCNCTEVPCNCGIAAYDPFAVVKSNRVAEVIVTCATAFDPSGRAMVQSKAAPSSP